MEIIKEIEGNIFDSRAAIIVHQVNCKGVMGAGLAKQVRQRYPYVFVCYRELCHAMRDTPEKLLGKAQIIDGRDGRYIANVFGQLAPGKGIQTDYGALRQALHAVAEWSTANNLRSIAIPYGLGCGLAGGDWTIVKNAIEETFSEYTGSIEIWCLRE